MYASSGGKLHVQPVGRYATCLTVCDMLRDSHGDSLPDNKSRATYLSYGEYLPKGC